MPETSDNAFQIVSFRNPRFTLSLEAMAGDDFGLPSLFECNQVHGRSFGVRLDGGVINLVIQVSGLGLSVADPAVDPTRAIIVMRARDWAGWCAMGNDAVAIIIPVERSVRDDVVRHGKLPETLTLLGWDGLPKMSQPSMGVRYAHTTTDLGQAFTLRPLRYVRYVRPGGGYLRQLGAFTTYGRALLVFETTRNGAPVGDPIPVNFSEEACLAALRAGVHRERMEFIEATMRKFLCDRGDVAVDWAK